MIAKQILSIAFVLNCVHLSTPHPFGTFSSPNFKQIFQILPKDCIIWFMMDQLDPPKQFSHADQPVINENSLHKKYIPKSEDQIKSLFLVRNAKCLIVFLYVTHYTPNNESTFLTMHYGIYEKYRKFQFHGIQSVLNILNQTQHYQNIFYVSLSPFLLHGNYSHVFLHAQGALYPKDRILFLALPNTSEAFACTLRIKSEWDFIAACNRLHQKLRYKVGSIFEQIFEVSCVIKVYDYSKASGRQNLRVNPLTSFRHDIPLNPASYIVDSVILSRNMSMSTIPLTDSQYPYLLVDAGFFKPALHFILLRSDPVIFITCYTFDQYISFKLYWSAFDYKISLCIFITFMALSLSLYVFLYSKNMVAKFSPWLFYFRFLVDEPVDIQKQLANNSTFNILTYPWIALSVIFTCLYTSSLVTDLNLPVAGKKLIHPNQTYCAESTRDNFTLKTVHLQFEENDYKKEVLKFRLQKYNKTPEDLAKFQIKKSFSREKQTPSPNWTHPETEFDMDLYFKRLQNPTNCFSFLSRPYSLYKEFFISDPSAYFFIHQLSSVRIKQSRERGLLRAKSIRNKYSPRLDKISQIRAFLNQTKSLRGNLIIEAAIEDEMIECGKTVYVAERSLVLNELEYLNLNHKNKFYAVKEHPFFYLRKGIKHGTEIRKKFHNYVLGFVESGIYKRIAEVTQENQYYRRRLATVKLLGGSTKQTVDKVRINNSIQTIFYLSLILVFIGTVVLAFEIQSLNLRSIFDGDSTSTAVDLSATVKSIVLGIIKVLRAENQKAVKILLNRNNKQRNKNGPKGIINIIKFRSSFALPLS